MTFATGAWAWKHTEGGGGTGRLLRTGIKGDCKLKVPAPRGGAATRADPASASGAPHQVVAADICRRASLGRGRNLAQGHRLSLVPEPLAPQDVTSCNGHLRVGGRSFAPTLQTSQPTCILTGPRGFGANQLSPGAVLMLSEAHGGGSPAVSGPNCPDATFRGAVSEISGAGARAGCRGDAGVPPTPPSTTTSCPAGRSTGDDPGAAASTTGVCSSSGATNACATWGSLHICRSTRGQRPGRTTRSTARGHRGILTSSRVARGGWLRGIARHGGRARA